MSLFRVSERLALPFVNVVYPPRCPACNTAVAEQGNLCGPCRAETPFVFGLACDQCGVPLPGEETNKVLCDDCLVIARPWVRGRAVLAYSGRARSLILAFKHGDRTELAPMFVGWMANTARDFVTHDTILVPVPVHWTRLVGRRYNQSALLANALSRKIGCPVIPDALVRNGRTPVLDGMTREERFATVDGVIGVHKRAGPGLAGRNILLIDDVMTSGATLSAATTALLGAGVRQVCVMVLARVQKDA